MDITDAIIEIQNKIIDIKKKDGVTQYSQGQLMAYSDCLGIIREITKIPVVFGAWYWVLHKDEFNQWSVKYLRLVKATKTAFFFTDKKCHIALLNFKSRIDIVARIGQKHAANYIFSTEEEAKKMLENKLKK